MRRQTVYPGAIPLETDLLSTNKNAMIAIGHVLQDMIGVSTMFSGLGCVPTSPAGMTVNVNPGRAYSYQATDSGAYSSLAADAHQIVKQGILLDAVNFACAAPTTAGYSINYLVEAAFQEVDAGSVVLPYYNASNPAQAYSGPNGTGTSNTTYRDNTVQLQLKAGVAATTGSQVTPTPDAGFSGLWVVSVPYGATTITAAMITQYSGAPFLSASLLAQIQACALLNGSSSQVFNVAPATLLTQAPPLSQVIQRGFNGSTLTISSATGTIPNTTVGGTELINSTITRGLPSAASAGSGGRIEVVAFAAGATIIPQPSDTIITGNGTSLTTLVFAAGDSAIFESNGATQWYLTGGSLAMKYAGNQAGVAASSGYVKFPSGIILQWGNGTTTSSGATTPTFPLPFPNACLNVVAGPQATGVGSMPNFGWQLVNKTTFNIYGSTTGAINYSYYAIGY